MRRSHILGAILLLLIAIMLFMALRGDNDAPPREPASLAITIRHTMPSDKKYDFEGVDRINVINISDNKCVIISNNRIRGDITVVSFKDGEETYNTPIFIGGFLPGRNSFGEYHYVPLRLWPDPKPDILKKIGLADNDSTKEPTEDDEEYKNDEERVDEDKDLEEDAEPATIRIYDSFITTKKGCLPKYREFEFEPKLKTGPLGYTRYYTERWWLLYGNDEVIIFDRKTLKRIVLPALYGDECRIAISDKIAVLTKCRRNGDILWWADYRNYETTYYALLDNPELGWMEIPEKYSEIDKSPPALNVIPIDDKIVISILSEQGVANNAFNSFLFDVDPITGKLHIKMSCTGAMDVRMRQEDYLIAHRSCIWSWEEEVNEGEKLFFKVNRFFEVSYFSSKFQEMLLPKAVYSASGRRYWTDDVYTWFVANGKRIDRVSPRGKKPYFVLHTAGRVERIFEDIGHECNSGHALGKYIILTDAPLRGENKQPEGGYSISIFEMDDEYFDGFNSGLMNVLH